MTLTHEIWPDLKYNGWKDTCQTLHLWTQIVGKIRMSLSPCINHSWHSTLNVTEEGLTTSVIYFQDRAFSILFDFIHHNLVINCNDGRSETIPLVAESVASFHKRCFGSLRRLGLDLKIINRPNEIPDAIPFLKDETHCSYDREYANRFWRILLQVDRVMKEFRSRYIGKVSPVHFFWGSFDLAVTRFSGRRAPEHPGGIPNLPDLITREAYSHEVSSCGFWPGNEQLPHPIFYSYAYPIPEGFESAQILPKLAFYHDKLREFILPYEVVRTAPSPDEFLLRFFQSTYEAAANLGHWDRSSLEVSPYLEELQASRRYRPAA